MDKFQNIFFRQRLEIKTVRGIVIRRDSFGVTIDHDGFNIEFRHGVGRVTTAIIKFNTLADAIRSAAEDNNLLAVRHTGFILHIAAKARHLISRVHIRGFGCKLCRASIHPLIDRAHACLVTGLTNSAFRFTCQLTNPNIGKPFRFNCAPCLGIFWQSIFGQPILRFNQRLNLAQEPRIKFRILLNFLNGKSCAEGLRDD